METKEIIKSLRLLAEQGIKIRDIETALNLPKNNLAGIISGSRQFPVKHKNSVEEYLKRQTKKRVILIEDEDGNWKDQDGRKCKLIWEVKKDAKNVPAPLDKKVENNHEEINAKIRDIRLEKISKDRDTVMGRKVWQKEQDARCMELEKLKD